MALADVAQDGARDASAVAEEEKARAKINAKAAGTDCDSSSVSRK